MTAPWLAALTLWAAICVGFLACGHHDKGAKHGG